MIVNLIIWVYTYIVIKLGVNYFFRKPLDNHIVILFGLIDGVALGLLIFFFFSLNDFIVKVFGIHFDCLSDFNHLKELLYVTIYYFTIIWLVYVYFKSKERILVKLKYKLYDGFLIFEIFVVFIPFLALMMILGG